VAFDIAPVLADVMKSDPHKEHDEWDRASPVSHIGPDTPPFFVIHGRNDSLLPVEIARPFVDALRVHSDSPAVYPGLPWAHAAYGLYPTVRAHAPAHAIERFLAYVRSHRRQPTLVTAAV